MENLPFGIFTYPSILLVCIICLLPLCPTKAIDCLDLINQYKIENAELADLQSLSRDVLSGERGQDLTATERLCLLHAIEEELMKDYDYEALISLGRQLEILADLEAPMEKVNEITNYEYLAKAYLELGVADSCVYYANRVEALLDPTVEEDLVQLLKIRQSKLMGLIDLLQFNRAEEMIAESEGWIKATGKERGAWGLFYYDKAVLINHKTDYTGALFNLDKAISYFESEPMKFKDEYVRALSSKGKFLSIIGRLKEGESILKDALKISLNQNEIDVRSQIISYCNLSQNYSYKKDSKKSKEMIDEGMKLAVGLKSSPFLLPKIYLFEMANHLDYNNLSEAIESCRKGHQIFNGLDIKLRNKNLSSTFSSAISFLSHDYFFETGDSAYLDIAKNASLAHFDYLKYFSVKSNQFGERFAMIPYEINDSKYILKMLHLADLNANKNENIPYFFDFFEFEKAQQINFNYLTNSLEKHSILSERNFTVPSEIDYDKFEIKNSKSDEKLINRHVRNSLEEDQISIIFDLLKTDNAVNRLSSFLDFSSTKDIQFLNYYIEEDRLNILSIYQSDVELFTVSISKDSIESLAKMFVAELSQLNITKEAEGKFERISNYLFSCLIEPLGDIESKSLVIVPHGILNRIPFEALCPKSNHIESMSWDFPYLVRKHVISYANSLQSFQFQESLKLIEKKHGILAMAPDFTKKTNVSLVRSNLSGLKFNLEEADFVGEISNGLVFKGENATIQNLKLFGTSANIIHLATHTYFEENSQYPSVILSHSEEDSFVKCNLVENFESGLKANLVILSACETALGPIEYGDGMVGIPQSIMRNGIPSVISSLWEINDKSTMSIMKSFYNSLKEGSSISKSLSTSKRNFLNNSMGLKKHPFFWAGIISNGRTENSFEHSFNSSINWRMPLICIGILIFFILVRNLR